MVAWQATDQKWSSIISARGLVILLHVCWQRSFLTIRSFKADNVLRSTTNGILFSLDVTGESDNSDRGLPDPK